MGTTGPTPQTVAHRQKLIDALESLGGEIVASEKSRLGKDELSRTLGIKMAGTGLATFLRNAEHDGIITRTVSGKRTKAIYLVHGARADVNYIPRTSKKGKVTEAQSTKRKYTKRQPETGKVGRPPKMRGVLPVPALGSTVSVFFASLAEDGQISIGLRGENGSWACEVRGFTKTE